MAESEIALHRDCEPLAWLLGTWRGSGRGFYPTIDDFEYEEELRFWHVGRPFLAYSQRTWSSSGAPMHSEMGYWRTKPDGAIELVLAHPFGVTEIEEGRIESDRITLASRNLASTSTAKRVQAVARTLWREDGILRYTVAMGLGEHPLQGHLEASLTRQ